MHWLFIGGAFLSLFLPTTASPSTIVDHGHWNELRGLTNPPRNTSQTHKSSPPIIIDTFQNPLHNDLGFWHGSGENLTVQHGPGFIKLSPTDPDQNYHTQFDTNACYSLMGWYNEFLHVIFEGTDQFSVSLNQHNDECNPRRSPFPGVADSVQAERYVVHPASELAGGGDDGDDDDCDEEDDCDDEDDWEEDDDLEADAQARNYLKNAGSKDTRRKHPGTAKIPTGRRELFIPLSHFNVDFHRVVSFSFHGFYTNESVTLHLVEIVPAVPQPTQENGHYRLPGKLPSGRLVLRCSRPGSFAFGIDDGQPQFSQEVMRMLDEENVRVTFFVVAAGLRDQTTNFTEFYKEMLRKGHQVAFHSNTHPKMEALPTLRDIDDEIIQTIATFKEKLGIESSYFRPPYGTVAARLRQQLARHIPNPYIVNWSVDVEDWLWANTTTPEKQLDAFYRSVGLGGNLAVMHYLNPTTIRYLPQFIRHVKSAGYQIMRIDQCLEDVSAPPL
ncbi:Glycoside hydrolase/deacetylase beta/alpha-barrel [Penicillium bovifimosum]|uniref:Glycoside hydrolase/deacetylase beta/alpha-barrel n=1 Tax=Penicillium bovifimosum TaxID=126998 RepID=A0A9W9GN95_9EURO|nr:Glycoside hydrolase/deacetylase beta/alpha-barrel [Penicillium bovifimosum]KAJ5124157.1 Glycoside hydrolase/deacetylase beta/alpha-barrel [Penicillium bovifimosum]